MSHDQPTVSGPNQYRCAACGGIFHNDWSAKNAEAELSVKFPDFTPDDCDIVCDDCYKAMGFGTEDGP